MLASAAGAFAMLQSLVSPVLPVIQRDLHTSASTVTWVLTAWLLAASVATPLMGRIGDMIGKDRTLLVALAAIAAGCLIAALAPNVGVLIAARVLQGLGGAVFPLAFGILRDEFPPGRMVSAVGGMSAVLAVGGGAGIVLAGPVVAALDWRWLFWLPFGVILVTLLLAYRWIPASPVRTPGRVNWLAAALLSGWLVALLLPLSKINAWGLVPVAGLLALAVALFAGWVAVELRAGNPLVDMRMMRLPAVWTTNVVALLFGAAMFSVYAFLPQFMQIPAGTGYGFGASVGRAGLLMLPLLVTMAVVGALSGPATRWLSSRTQVICGAVLGAVSCVMLALAHTHPWQVALAAGVFGVGIGLAYAAMTSLIVHSVPVAQTGVASGMNANIRTIGASIGTAAVSAIVTHGLRPDGLPRESGFTTAFAVLAGAATLAVLVALLIPRTRRTAPAPAPAPAPTPSPSLAGTTAS
ncbi:MFS transporter [Dactylosporangium sp. AC04546]|uniref:MFS transporter n=1 Tax=Dactylosporangium sp. AC04546 TaxID=2862460 RepID=UPI002E7AF21D|nr:MFS transporter [Dactylosporangium sp. AC04546]WVK89296.1 MFS transporter [Dactylosporangium sp. AC04546]